jgi:hypothetical protein
MTTTNELIDFLLRPSRATLIHGKVLNAGDQQEIDNILQAFYKVCNITMEDVLIIADLDFSIIEDIVNFCNVEPYGYSKLVVVNLNGCSYKTQSGLLKVLEADYEKVRFVIFTDVDPLVTLSSRCSTYKIYPQVSDELKTLVLKALASSSLKEFSMIEAVLKGWTTEASQLLKTWALERLSKCYLVFARDEVEGLGFPESFAYSLVEALEVLKMADSKRAVYSILFSYASR